MQINKKCNAIYQGAFKVYKLNWNFKDYQIVIKIYSLLFGTDFFPVLKLRLLVEVVMMSGGMSDMAGEGVTCMLWVMQAGMSPVRLWDRLGGMSPTPFMLDVSPEKQNWHLFESKMICETCFLNVTKLSFYLLSSDCVEQFLVNIWSLK